MADPYDDLSTPRVAVINPGAEIDEGRAREYMDAHRSRATKSEEQFDSIMAQRRAAIEEARSTLDRTIQTMRDRQTGAGLGQVNLPLLALGAGLLQGGEPGTATTFGQDLSRGLRAMGTTIRSQRMSDTDFERGVAELQQKSAGLRDKSLDDEAALARQKSLKEDAMVGEIEKALIKSGGAAGKGADPAAVKEFREWSKDPKNAGKTFAEFLEFKARLGADKNNPASLRELASINAEREQRGLPPLTLEEYKRAVAAATAGGRETGKSQAEAALALPTALATIDTMQADIDKLVTHPGLKNATGFNSYFPSVRGGKAADFEALMDKLKGQAFLVQFDKLRGAGAITDFEGKKATDAIAALQNTQNPKQLVAQLKEMRDLLERGRARLREKAGQEGGGSEAPGAPVVVRSPADIAKLPQGALFIAADDPTQTPHRKS